MKNETQDLQDLQTIITLHWWNFRKRQLDFSGTLKDCLESKRFKCKKIKHPTAEDVTGYRFNIGLSSNIITLDVYHSSFADAAISAIRLFLTALGDKATIATENKFIKINH